MEKQRLAKYLAAAGIASRRKCEELIFAGRVRVNGETILLAQTMVNHKDSILVDGKKVRGTEKKVYFIFNKPEGYLCTSSRDGSKKIVLDLFKGVPQRIFTVGRLDKDTSGLLLVTNDGEFANKIIHPSSNIPKEYVVKTGIEITDQHLKAISKGTNVEGVFVKPLKVTKLRRGTLKIIISEGKKREVRYLVNAAGLDAIQLKRTRIGGLRLGNLPLGAWRQMTEREKQMVFESKKSSHER